MNRHFTIALSVLLLTATNVQAQSDRSGTWEVGFHLTDSSSVSRAGTNGSSISVDDETGWGFSGAYNFNARFAVGTELTWVDPKYVATLVPDGPGLPQRIGANLEVSTVHLKAIINLLDSDFTPYIEIGGGWSYIDSNIVEGIAGSGCWWDPWYGYVCNTFFDTYTDTRTSTSAAVGIRWEIESNMMFKASWGLLEVDTNRATQDIEVDTIQIGYGWRF